MSEEEKEYNRILAHAMRCPSCAYKLQEILLHTKGDEQT